MADEHVHIRAPEHLAGTFERPSLGIGVETRDRPGPAFKQGVFSEDTVWIQLRGGLIVARARVKLAWRGEYSRIEEVRRRGPGGPVPESFWAGRPRAGYAVVATLEQERWVEPYWGGPRTYAYEWIVLENEAKRRSWLDPKDPPRGGADLLQWFLEARKGGFPQRVS